MSEPNDTDQFMKQYFSMVQGYMKKFMDDPKALGDILTPMMDMYENSVSGQDENSKSNLIDSNSNASTSENKEGDSQVDLHDKMRKIIRTLVRIEKESDNQKFDHREEIKKVIRSLIKIERRLFPKDNT